MHKTNFRWNLPGLELSRATIPINKQNSYGKQSINLTGCLVFEVTNSNSFGDSSDSTLNPLKVVWNKKGECLDLINRREVIEYALAAFRESRQIKAFYTGEEVTGILIEQTQGYGNMEKMMDKLPYICPPETRECKSDKY